MTFTLGHMLAAALWGFVAGSLVNGFFVLWAIRRLRSHAPSPLEAADASLPGNGDASSLQEDDASPVEAEDAVDWLPLADAADLPDLVPTCPMIETSNIDFPGRTSPTTSRDAVGKSGRGKA